MNPISSLVGSMAVTNSKSQLLSLVWKCNFADHGAREVQASDDPKDFEKAFKKVAPTKPAKKG
jgi:hypothetical protein